MPTPVTTARQCLTPDAARALDDAVSVARRRCHPQTTSLHALSALLSLPSSSLRDACSRVRNSAYSPRLQLRALELCFGAALERLPSSQQQSRDDDPPISNSLMAAIKRSQANQRRHPESFHFYQQQLQLQQQQQQLQPQSSSSSGSSSSTTISCVKVELQQLILSILDDPVVSRVFGEAGFRSCDVKLAIVRPPLLQRFNRYRRPPLFLCNLTGDEDCSGQGQGQRQQTGRRGFDFPFSSGVFLSDGEENCRRIGEVLARKKERNPLLVGVYASEAARSFAGMVERGKIGGVLGEEISGLSFVSIENEVSRFVSGSGREEVVLCSRFEELNRTAESCSGPGIVVSFGDLKVFVDNDVGGGSVDPVGYVVAQLTKLLEIHRPKLWLMGATASYEMYLKFLTRFPSIEKDWDLQLLPITSLRGSYSPSSSSSYMGGLHTGPHSLMESFVPFGGFFTSPTDLKDPFSSSTYQPISRCSTCNEKCEQEISKLLNGGCSLSVADHYQETLPPWLQMAEVNTKAKDDGTALNNAKIAGLQKKWNDICRRLNHRLSVSEAGNYQVRAPMFPGIAGFPFATSFKDKADGHSSSNVNAASKESPFEKPFPIISMGLQNVPRPLVSEVKNDGIQGQPSRVLGLRVQDYQFPEHSVSNSSNPNHHQSPSSAASVTTDLGLGTIYASSSEELNKHTFQAHKERLKDISGCFPSSKLDVANTNIASPSARSPSCFTRDFSSLFDPKDFKTLYRCLVEKVGRQDEAIHAISQTIARCRTGNERRRGASMRRDIWFSFVGPDRAAKRKIAVALAEIIFGSQHNLIWVDLSSLDGSTSSNTIFDSHEFSGDDVKFRGKTIVDHIAEEITKKPISIVFLENIDKADMLVQTSLSQAIKRGKFQDTYGREISIHNSIFVTTSRVLKDKEILSFSNDLAKFSEERILEAQRLEMQILVNHVPEVNKMRKNANVMVSFDPALVKKRKQRESDDVKEHDDISVPIKRAPKTSKCLDLNLPIEEVESDYADCRSGESDSVSENTQLWLEDFLDQMDGTVFFKPFDFDALANRTLKEMSMVITSRVGSEVLLEIDPKVMEQIIAAAWSSDGENTIADWVDRVLGSCLTEAHQRYSLNARSVLKLINCEGLRMKEQAAGVCLPARVILN